MKPVVAMVAASINAIDRPPARPHSRFMPDGLYDRDALAWSEQQADLLRRLAHGERVNAEIDWPNLVEEVIDVGLSELRACENLLGQAMMHLIKLRFGPEGPARHWTAEIVGFLDQARRRFTPSMRQQIRLEDEYLSIRRRAAILFGDRAGAMPSACPWTIDDLLAAEADIPALARRISPDRIGVPP